MANMYEINGLLRQVSDGEITVDEANDTLKDWGVTAIHLDSKANIITDDDMKETSISGDFETVNGYVLLDTGTGYKNKVKVVNNVLMDVDIGNMYGLALIGDFMWEVKGNKIVKYKGMRKKS